MKDTDWSNDTKKLELGFYIVAGALLLILALYHYTHPASNSSYEQEVCFDCGQP